jgi:hypothetical protein
MLNLSIAHLTLFQVTSSSIFAFSYRPVSISLTHSIFKRSFSPIVYSPSPLALTLRHSVFERFLSGAIHINSLDYFNTTIDTRRICLLVGPANISHCIFRLCVSRNVPGGALFIVTDASFVQCLFSFNSAPSAGSVYSNGNLTTTSVTFEGGYSPTGSGFVSERSPDSNVTLVLTVFVNLDSANCSCFHRSSGAFTSVVHCNFSTNAADCRTAGVAICDTSAFLQHCLFFDLQADTDTALVLTRTQNATVEWCLFWMLRGGDRSGGSVALSVRESPVWTTAVTLSSFFRCDNPRGPIVRAFDGSRIAFVQVCVTSNLTQFVGDGVGIAIGEDSRMAHDCGDRFRIVAPTVFGYHTFDRHENIAAIRVDMFDGGVIGALFVVAFAVPVGVTMILLSQIAKLCAGENEDYERLQ